MRYIFQLGEGVTVSVEFSRPPTRRALEYLIRYVDLALESLNETHEQRDTDPPLADGVEAWTESEP